MKKQTEKQLAEKAQAVFKSHPKEQTVHATEDGQFFLDGNRSLARDHARQNELEMFTFSRDAEPEEKPKAKAKAKAGKKESAEKSGSDSDTKK